MEKYVVTSYINPDMDGISAMYAYSEYLNKCGKKSCYYYEGTVKKEVQIVSEMYGIEINNNKIINSTDKIVLVDTNSLEELPKRINKNNIVEIYDHHKRTSWLDNKENISINIEWIGAAATLIAEKFRDEKIDISRESAILLYFGIISNTMNLKIKMTTKRDIEISNWLKSKVPEISDKDIETVFIKKSNIIQNLREEMEVELVDKFMSISWTMGQLEIANVESFLNENETQIRKILEDIHNEKNVKYVSVNCMDIINGYSIIVAYNQETADLIQKDLGIEFHNLKGRTTILESRKEMVKIMRDKYKINFSSDNSCKEKILVSACLLGLNCKYNGENNYSKKIDEFLKDYEVIPICPEIMGGLPTPRISAERLGNKVITKDGKDVTKEYIKGANECLFLAKKYNVKKALLKSKSPSCGNEKIYDGSFSHTIIDGDGVTAELLKNNGIEIISIK